VAMDQTARSRPGTASALTATSTIALWQSDNSALRPQNRFTKAYFRSLLEGCAACSVGTSNRSSRTSVLIICATAMICLPLNFA
jgi:hypothetical protein